jgi:hypothetical protein
MFIPKTRHLLQSPLTDASSAPARHSRAMRDRPFPRQTHLRAHSWAPAILAVTTASWLIAASVAPAAGITWNTAQNISADTDVSTTGTLLEAFALDSAGTTINGVAFQGITSGFGNHSLAIGANDSYSVTLRTISTLSDASGNAPYDKLPSEYQSLLGNMADPGDTEVATLQLGGLTVGQTYQVELWMNFSDDSVAVGEDLTVTAGNTATLSGNTTESNGGLGQYITGTFTADASTESIAVGDPDSSGAYLNGYEVRNITPVPEPGTALFGLSLSGLCLAGRWRRR